MSFVLIKQDNHRVISLRTALTKLVYESAKQHFGPCQKYSPWEIQGEMEDPKPPQGDASAEISKTSTVETQMQSGESVGSSLPMTSPAQSYRELAAAHNPIAESTFCDRTYTFKQVTWKSTMKQGEEIKEFNLELPKDILDLETFRQSPNYLLFSRHMYWRGDLEIEIKCNANQRQFGQLQFSFYYGDSQDSDYENRNNIYSNSQRLHTLLTANFSNTCLLKIPFEYVFPTMAINKASQKGMRTLGRLRCFVVVPLTVTSTTVNHCSLLAMVRFKNCSFQGMVGSAIAEGEMFSLASIIAVKSLIDSNRDRPSLTSPAMPLIPVNASSWCFGTGQADYQNILRLDPNCALPYAEGRVPSIDEMKIDYIKRIFGMVMQSNWSAQQMYGTKLFSLDAVPLESPDQYQKILDGDRKCYAVPPIGMLTSLFSYWRGSLELRIDIVGCTEITGALLICYVPRVNQSYDLKIHQAIDCAHAIYDIQENRQISFKIPYVASQMFWPRRSTVSPYFSVYEPPGAVFCFVMNSLVVNSTIPDNCQLVLYLRGGEDFELAVPASPSLGLAFNTKVYVPDNITNKIIPLEGYSPVFSGTWRNAYCNLKVGVDITTDGELTWKQMTVGDPHPEVILSGFWYVPILRYSNVSDHVAQFKYITPDASKLQKNYVAKIISVMSNNNCLITLYPETAGNVNREFKGIKYIAISKIGSQYVYGYPLPTEEFAKLFNKYADYTYDPQYFKNHPMEIAWVMAFSQIYYSDYSNTSLLKKGYNMQPRDSEYWDPANFIAQPYLVAEAIEGQMDEREKLVAPPAEPQATASQSSASKLVFGEQFLDLKDYCRRYQLYSTGNQDYDFKTPGLINLRRTLMLRFPVLPQGLMLDLGTKSQIAEYWNRTREGPIPFIASGYRFFTGGLRFRICINVTSVNRTDDIDPIGKISVQHRPNILNTTKRVVIADHSDFNTDDLELPGYATWHQFENLNNVLSVEVPFYIPAIRTYLQPLADTYLANHFGSLGELAVGISVYNLSNFRLNWDIYYCLADDARFSVFVGFPGAFDITNLPSITPELKISNELQTLVINSSNNFIKEDDDFEKVDVAQCELAMIKDLKFDTKLKRYTFNCTNINYESYAPEPILSIDNLMALELKRIYNLRKEVIAEGQMMRSLVGAVMGGDKVVTETTESLQKVNDIVKDVDSEKMKQGLSFISSIKENVSESIMKIVPSAKTIEDTFHKYVDLAINAVTNLLHCLINFNIKTVIVALVSFLTQLKVFSFSVLDYARDKLMNFFSWLFSQHGDLTESVQQQVDSMIPEGNMAVEAGKEENESVVCAFISTLVAGVASTFHLVFSITKNQTKHISEILFNGLGKFAFTANHLFTFVKNNLIAIKKIAEWMFGDHPSLKSISFLKDSQVSLHRWATQVCEITDPRRENEVFESARLSTQVFLLAQQANLLQVHLLELKLKDVQMNVMSTLIKKIMDLRDKLARSHLAPPIRFEPYVYELAGPSGIGKSELMKSLPYTIFNALGFKHNGPLIYHRTLGNAYWNGLRNQPVLNIDEKFPVRVAELLGAQLAEIFQLKSSCVFNPPMAAVEDKHVKYNPIIIQMASNHPFVDLPEFINREAVYRRRDDLVEVRIKPEIQEKYPDLKEKVKYNDLTWEDRGRPDRFEYLEFRFAQHVWDPATAYTRWMHFNEFKHALITKFHQFYIHEESKFRREIERIKSILPVEGEQYKNFDEILNYQWLDTFQDGSSKVKEIDLDLTRKLYEIRNKTLYNRKYDRFSSETRNKLYSLNAKIQMAEYSGVPKEKIDAYRQEAETLEKKLDKALKEKSFEDEFLMDRPEGQMDTPKETGAIPKKSKKIQVEADKIWEPPIKQFNEADLTNSKPDKIESFMLDMAVKQLGKYDNSDPNFKSNGASTPNPFCRCYNVINTIKHNLGQCDFNKDHQAFLMELNETFITDFVGIGHQNMKYNSYIEQVKGENPDMIFTENNKEYLRMKIEPCKNPKGVCLFRSLEERIKFYVEYIKMKPHLMTQMLIDHIDWNDILPLEYIEHHTSKTMKGMKEQVKDQKELEQKVYSLFSIEGLKNWFYYLRDTLYEISWRKYLKKISIVIGVVGMIVMFLKGFNYFTNKSVPGADFMSLDEAVAGTTAAMKIVGADQVTQQKMDILNEFKEVIGQAHVSGDYKTAKYVGKAARPAFNALKGTAEGQMGVINEEHVKKVLRRNTFWLSTDPDNGCTMAGKCLGLYGHKAIIVSHYWEAWQQMYKKTGDNKMLYISCIDGRISCLNTSIDKIKFESFEKGSLGILTLPKQIPNFVDIRNLIAPREVHKNLNGLASLYEYKYNNVNVDLNVKHVELERVNQIHCAGNELWTSFEVFEGYEYDGFAGKGMCGSVLVAEGCRTPIIGIHVAGLKMCNHGFSEVIYREMFSQKTEISSSHVIGEGNMSVYFVDGEVMALGKVPAKMAHREHEYSRIIPSIPQLSGEFKVYSEPAVLSKKDPRIKNNPFSPMLEGVKHHGKPLAPFDREDLAIAAEDLENLILANCKPQRPVSMLSRHEAVGGIDDLPGYEHMEFATSEGFPFVGMRPNGATNKKWLFEFDDQNKFTKISPLLNRVLDNKWDQRLNSQIPATVFTDCLKDCTIDSTKVREPGKTRVFSMSPVDFTIQQRQCTLDFVVAYMANRRNLEHMIGCNPNSIEWTYLARDLLSKGNSIATGDYSKFGDTIPPEFIHIVFCIIRKWYVANGYFNEEHQQQLKIMPYEIANSIHLCFDHLYQVFCGQPSGNSLTVIVNSLANSLYMRLAWLEIMRNTPFNSLADFHTHVKMFSYGDDLIVSLSDEIKWQFNAVNWHKFFGYYRLKFTNSNKSGEIVPFTSLSEADFLKSGFKPHPYRTSPQLFLACLGEQSIEDTPNWVWKESFGRSEEGSLTYQDMCIQVCGDSLRNAFGRGPEYYMQWRCKIIEFWRNRGKYLSFDTWSQLDNKIFDFGQDLTPFYKFRVKIL